MTIGSKDINQKPVSGNPDTEPKFPNDSKSTNVTKEKSDVSSDPGDIHHVQHRPLDRSREHAPDDTFPGSGPSHWSN